MSNRISTSNLIKTLLLELNKAPGSIADLSKRSGINFNSVKTYLEMLSDSNVVAKEIANNKIIYILKNNCYNDKDTYFGLPIKQEIKEKVYSLYSYITKKWKETTTKPISKTQIQKILYKTNKNFNLNLPFGWFKYGQACAVPYSYNMNYDNFFKDLPDNITKDLDINITNCINENVTKTKEKHYIDENNPVYIAKEKIIKELNTELKSLDIKIILNLYNMILDNEAKKINKNTMRLLDDYSQLLKDLFKLNNIDDVANEVRESFNIIWDLISTFIYKEDMKKYITNPNIVENCFIPNIIETREKVIDVCINLKSYLPFKEIKKNDNYLKLKEIQEKMKQKLKNIS